ncbi:hypothetical protein T484DRAFT_1743821 [Baffinella frigidus]|nr:hypothetical protein T484DRAFT_1743821 [Cryptophyta sp. CCMP2293]
MLIKRSAGALICLLALADAAVSPGSITPSRVFPPAFSPRSPILDHVDGVELSSELGNAVVSRQGQLQLLLRGGNDEEEPAEEPAWGAWLHDAEEGSLTLAWAAVPEASVYEVQLRKEGADEWTSLSAKITGTMLKKKNLDPSSRHLPPSPPPAYR